jgi:hypothetical protein
MKSTELSLIGNVMERDTQVLAAPGKPILRIVESLKITCSWLGSGAEAAPTRSLFSLPKPPHNSAAIYTDS